MNAFAKIWLKPLGSISPNGAWSVFGMEFVLRCKVSHPPEMKIKNILFGVALRALDILMLVRGVSRPKLTRFVVSLGLFALSVAVMFGMASMSAVTRDMRSITDDVIISMRATRDMRTAFFETRLHILRFTLEQRAISKEEVDAFASQVHSQLEAFREGVITPTERPLLKGIESSATDYLKKLRGIEGRASLSKQEILEIDASGTRLADILSASGSLNSDRLDRLATRAKRRAVDGLSLSYVMWGGVTAIVVLSFFLLLLSRFVNELHEPHTARKSH
jgi:hypothetical protein